MEHTKINKPHCYGTHKKKQTSLLWNTHKETNLSVMEHKETSNIPIS
jgi:CDGSH-type Zn-finger protein